MDFTASNGGSGGSYEKPRPGTYTGILIGVADLGTHVGQFGAKRRVMLRWELHKRKGPSLDTSGAIHTISAMYNQTFDVKSSLRPVIEAHVGPIKDGDRIGSRDWLGRAAKLVLKETDDSKYVNVEAVTPLDPEEDETPRQHEASEHWEVGDATVPPSWCKWMVERSSEWQQAHGASRPAPVAVGAGTLADDESPF